MITLSRITITYSGFRYNLLYRYNYYYLFVLFVRLLVLFCLCCVCVVFVLYLCLWGFVFSILEKILRTKFFLGGEVVKSEPSAQYFICCSVWFGLGSQCW